MRPGTDVLIDKVPALEFLTSGMSHLSMRGTILRDNASATGQLRREHGVSRSRSHSIRSRSTSRILQAQSKGRTHMPERRQVQRHQAKSSLNTCGQPPWSAPASPSAEVPVSIHLCPHSRWSSSCSTFRPPGWGGYLTSGAPVTAPAGAATHFIFFF